MAGSIYFALGERGHFFEYIFAAMRDRTLRSSELLHAPLFTEVRNDDACFQQLPESVRAEMGRW